MPINSFSPSFLRGAAPGLGRLARAVGSGKDAYQDAFDNEGLKQSRISQAIASQHANEAKANQDNVETRFLENRPGLYEEQVANSSGFDIPTVQAYRGQLAGKAPQVPMGPPTEDGDMGVGTFKAGPEARSKLSLAIQQFLPLVANKGDLKPDDLAQAANGFGEIGLRDDVLAGRRTADSLADAQGALKGKLPAAQGQAKTPTGFRWSDGGDSLEPIPGGPKDQKVYPPKPQKAPAAQTPIDRDRVAILSQELFNTREGMKTAVGPALVRAQSDEASIVAELRRLGVKDVGQLPKVSKVAAAETAKVGDAKEVLGLLTDAEAQLKDATGSFAGNLVDQGARAVGYSTKGAQAAARLKGN